MNGIFICTGTAVSACPQTHTQCLIPYLVTQAGTLLEEVIAAAGLPGPVFEGASILAPVLSGAVPQTPSVSLCLCLPTRSALYRLVPKPHKADVSQHVS